MNRRRFLIAGAASITIIWVGAVVVAQSDQLTSPSSYSEEPPATPEASPAIYSGDIRDLWVKPWKFEDQWVSFRGVAEQVRVAPPGEGFKVGTDSDFSYFRSQVVVEVDVPGDERETLLVVINADMSGIYDGDTVEVVAKPAGRHQEPAGGSGYWPFDVVVANTIKKVDPGTPQA